MTDMTNLLLGDDPNIRKAMSFEVPLMPTGTYRIVRSTLNTMTDVVVLEVTEYQARLDMVHPEDCLMDVQHYTQTGTLGQAGEPEKVYSAATTVTFSEFITIGEAAQKEEAMVGYPAVEEAIISEDARAILAMLLGVDIGTYPSGKACLCGHCD